LQASLALELKGFSPISSHMTCLSFCFPFFRRSSAKAKTCELSGTSAIITGSSEGLGVAIAHQLAAEGVTKIALAALGKDKLEDVAEDIRQKHPGTTVLTRETDVSNFSDCELLVEEVLKNFGCCDILVNNAGIAGVSPFDVATAKRLDAIIDVNLKGTMYLARCVLPSMVQAGRGHIVNIGSMSTKRIEPYNTVYMASKMGVLGWSHGLRAEMQTRKTGVTVHLVNPGILSDGGMAVNHPAATRAVMAEAMKVGGSSTRAEVTDAIINVIKYDIPEMTVNSKDFKWEVYEPVTEWFKAVAEEQLVAKKIGRCEGQHCVEV